MNKPAPFTMNQKSFYDRCFTSWFNVAEGGKRGGKNVLTTLAYCLQLETHPNKLHLIAGVSIATAKLNILDCDGFGLLNYFEGRCKSGKYQNRDCLYVQTATGEKVILVSGGGKEGDQKLIQGNTYGMAYVTEANLCADSFIREVFDRTLSSKKRKVFHDLNPKAAGHPYYSNVLAHHEKQQLIDPAYGYNYGHFTIADNMSMTMESIRKVLATYDKTSVWYKRDILGLRCAAEGLVYPQFSDKHIFKGAVKPARSYYISIDYGTVNPCSMGMWGITGREALREKEYYYDSRKEKRQKTDEDYYRDLETLAYGKVIEYIVIDPSATSFITTIRRHGKFRVKEAENEVINGIRITDTLIQCGFVNIHESCNDAIREFGLYSWDEKSNEDKVIKEFDHAMDDIRYFCATILSRELRWVDWGK